jgi:DNA mismatch repair protein MutL
MPIANLPPQTVRAICSSQVLTDPVSVVKELVENALDAGASAIFIDISLNALDVIQVKDNGHGIAPEDRALVCRRYCTSKIRDLDDLSRIGGTSLGFRGEALASAAELSESVTVLTRIEGEAFATSIKFDRLGEIIRYACFRVLFSKYPKNLAKNQTPILWEPRCA